jgi:hypothetical protein
MWLAASLGAAFIVVVMAPFLVAYVYDRRRKRCLSRAERAEMECEDRIEQQIW